MSFCGQGKKTGLQRDRETENTVDYLKTFNGKEKGKTMGSGQRGHGFQAVSVVLMKKPKQFCRLRGRSQGEWAW